MAAGAATLGRQWCGLACALRSQVQERLGDVRLPVLVVHRTAEVISPPADARRRAAGLPDTERQLLDGIGHVPIFTAPATVARLIDTRFMQAAVAMA